jgi:hypothetical protein
VVGCAVAVEVAARCGQHLVEEWCSGRWPGDIWSGAVTAKSPSNWVRHCGQQGAGAAPGFVVCHSPSWWGVQPQVAAGPACQRASVPPVPPGGRRR